MLAMDIQGLFFNCGWQADGEGTKRGFAFEIVTEISYGQEQKERTATLQTKAWTKSVLLSDFSGTSGSVSEHQIQTVWQMPIYQVKGEFLQVENKYTESISKGIFI